MIRKTRCLCPRIRKGMSIVDDSDMVERDREIHVWSGMYDDDDGEEEENEGRKRC